MGSYCFMGSCCFMGSYCFMGSNCFKRSYYFMGVILLARDFSNTGPRGSVLLLVNYNVIVQ